MIMTFLEAISLAHIAGALSLIALFLAIIAFRKKQGDGRNGSQ